MKFPKYVIAVIWLCTSHSVIAANIISVENCKSIPNAKERLECYDSFNGKETTKSNSSSENSSIKNAIRLRLTDPSSATFGKLFKVKFPDESKCYCLEVNSRNKFGGYAGNKASLVCKNPHEDGGWSVQFNDGSCAEAWESLLIK